MDAKRELVNQLCEMFPNDKARISEILSCYTVRRESDCRSNLKQQLHSFLIAKKVEGEQHPNPYQYPVLLFQLA